MDARQAFAMKGLTMPGKEPYDVLWEQAEAESYAASRRKAVAKADADAKSDEAAQDRAERAACLDMLKEVRRP